jgi:hypothetical protein
VIGEPRRVTWNASWNEEAHGCSIGTGSRLETSERRGIMPVAGRGARGDTFIALGDSCRAWGTRIEVQWSKANVL